MNDQKYITNLENIIKQMLCPLKNIPLGLVIEGISGKRIIPFNATNPKDKRLLSNLIKTANLVGVEINKLGIKRSRPNEVGNDIEPFVKRQLNKMGYKADTPKSKNGKKKSMGYPDIEFIDHDGRANYLECKTYNLENINSAQRSFYLSPSEEFKITTNAHHLIISYEIYVAGRKAKLNVYKCKSWKIVSAEKLNVDVKYEFNSDNDRMYKTELILAEGDILTKGRV